jgi:hypothetical protein
MTIAFRDGDVAALFADMGVPVTIGGTPGLGLVDENDQIVVSNAGRGEVVGGVHTVTVQTSQFPAITNGMPIIVDSVTYSVRQKLKEGDAALTKILLGSV